MRIGFRCQTRRLVLQGTNLQAHDRPVELLAQLVRLIIEKFVKRLIWLGEF